VDSVIYKIVPDFEVARQMLKNDETQAMAYLSEPSAIKDMYDNGFTVKAQGAWINFLQINPFDPKDLSKPHPFLGDKKVRQAVYMAIDRTKSTYNWAVQGVFEQSLITSLWDLWPQYRCDVPAWPNDKEGAKKLLAEAGWVDTNGDGVLECESCTTTAKGTPFKIRMSSYTGWGMEDNEVVVIDELKQVGIDAQVQNYEATVMYSSWADGSFMYKGDFDLIWWDDNPLMPDPQQRSMMWYASDFIPSEKNPTGMNFSRINDPEIDAWLKEAGSTPDTAKRKEAYCKIAKKVNQEYVVQQANGLIPYVSVSAPYIKGWDVNEVYAPMGWDIANWYIEK
jgi:peptide/nickel transport system substrate-binding protein